MLSKMFAAIVEHHPDGQVFGYVEEREPLLEGFHDRFINGIFIKEKPFDTHNKAHKSVSAALAKHRQNLPVGGASGVETQNKRKSRCQKSLTQQSLR